MHIKTKNILSNDLFLFTLIAAAIFIIRVPFLFILPGYGADPDAWRVIQAAQKIAYSGSYHVSRLPGYPVHEIVCSLFIKFSPLILNGLTLFLSSISIAFFSLTITHLKLNNIFLSGLALAFTPIVFVNSFVTLDYLWSSAFIMGSLYFILRQKNFTAGVLLGLAIGCRITSGAMCLPLALILIQKNRRYYRGAIVFLISSFITGTICFVPVFLKFGWDFFSYNQPGPVTTKILIQRLFFQVWGDAGVYVICICLIAQIILILKTKKTTKYVEKLTITASVISILLYLTCFLKLPDEAAYMIPAIPFVILLLNLFLHKILFSIVCLSLAVSPFVSIQKKYAPPFQARYYQRVYRQNMIDDVEKFLTSNNRKTVIVCFDWYPFLSVGLDETIKSKTNLMFSLDKHMLKELQSNGFTVYYVPNKRERTYRKHRMTLQSNGAKPLFE